MISCLRKQESSVFLRVTHLLIAINYYWDFLCSKVKKIILCHREIIKVANFIWIIRRPAGAGIDYWIWLKLLSIFFRKWKRQKPIWKWRKNLIQIYSKCKSALFTLSSPDNVYKWFLPCLQSELLFQLNKKKTDRTTFGTCNQNRKLTKQTFVRFHVFFFHLAWTWFSQPIQKLNFFECRFSLSFFLFLLLWKFTFLFHFYLSILSFFFLSLLNECVCLVICIRLADLQLLIALSVPVCGWIFLCDFSFHFCFMACSTILIIFMSFKNIKFLRQQ